MNFDFLPAVAAPRSIRLVAALLVCLSAPVAAQDVTAADFAAGRVIEADERDAPTPDESRRRSRILAELSTGASMIGLGSLAWAAVDSSDPVQISIVVGSPFLLGSGTFSLFHGAARLRVHSALVGGEPIDALRIAERRIGRRQSILGGSLLGVGLAISCAGFAGQGGGPNPVLAGTFFGLGGVTGASGFFLMEHAIYRLHFGRSGRVEPVAIAPDVRISGDGFTVGVAGTL